MTPTCSGVPKQEDKIRSGNITPTFSRAQSRAQMLRKPFVRGGPQTRGENPKWHPQPCVLQGRLWALRKVGVREPLLVLSPSLGTPEHARVT